MGSYHPHGDSSIYDTLVRLAQPWSLRYPLVDGQGNFGSPGNDTPAAMRYTECKLAPIAMEMLRDIDKETVDFQPNYDGRSQEPMVLPSRFPNLLVNGAASIAVGMATNIPPHNLREIGEAVKWALENYEATDEELLEGLIARVKGPDFPTGALIVGKRGIDDAYRTGRGSITMRAVVEVEEDNKGRQCLVITELPYQVNPDNLALSIAELVKEGKINGIADVRDESSSRVGQRLVVVLKRDAVAKVVLNNLYKHTQLQTTFGANMLALVDGVPRTLRLDQFVKFYIGHQIEVVVRRTRYLLRKAEERAHILRGLLKALERLDDVIALIRVVVLGLGRPAGPDGHAGDRPDRRPRRSWTCSSASSPPWSVSEIQDEFEHLMAQITEYNGHPGQPAPPARQIVGDELGEIITRFGDERKTEIIAYDGDMSIEDLIAEDEMVVTITRGGYAKRTNTDLYRAQKRGGKGVRGRSSARTTSSSTSSSPQPTTGSCSSPTRAGSTGSRRTNCRTRAGTRAGSTWPTCWPCSPTSEVMEVLDLRDYEVAPYLVLATRSGLVKKTRLSEYDSPRSGGLIAINLRDDDEVIAARLVSEAEDLLLVSKNAQAIRFTASTRHSVRWAEPPAV